MVLSPQAPLELAQPTSDTNPTHRQGKSSQTRTLPHLAQVLHSQTPPLDQPQYHPRHSSMLHCWVPARSQRC
uniref:Uncharacterized protein n=1 Tax=Arundo donax TaxID=35708 RepID=A0A0A9HGK5_ARUDO